MEYFNFLWNYINVSAPFLLLGFIAAGGIHLLMSTSIVSGQLKGHGPWPVIKASLLGIPLPLCSCGVIPAAVTLRESGVSKGATSSFLISTPESGVDSISVTYAMMGWPMAVIRPIAAFLSALVAGLLQNSFNNKEEPFEKEEKKSCCSKDQPSLIKKYFSFVFGKLVNDLAFWLILGLLGGAAIDWLLPEGFLESLNGLSGRMVMMVIGIPLYICASATTPLAAGMIAKGMSPGTALILLLVGPATNFSNLIVLQKYLGKKGILINILAIAVVSLLASYGVDFVFERYQLKLTIVDGHQHGEDSSIIQTISSVVLIILLLKGLWVKNLAPFFKGKAI